MGPRLRDKLIGRSRLAEKVIGPALTVVILLLTFLIGGAAEAATSTLEIETAIEANVTRVPEFVFIRQEAEKLGVKAYLFGGTAAGFAHYVKNDLERLKGDKAVQAQRFDYDFTNIFRSTQDLDVVVDGPADKIERLKEALVSKYPHFVGGKAAKWELRSLRESKGKPGESGYKEALLDSPDFLNQNSDSNSTGLIEVTKSSSGDVVLDLRDRSGRPSQFLRDVAAGEISFYESAQHKSTPRARAGNNPEIFSVMRALTKAFQYDLKFRSGDWAAMQAIVNRFDPSEIEKNADTKRRFIDVGVKLFMHAVDVERAWNDLESLGLRTKLVEFDSPNTEGSLAWWMNKEPLRTKPVGQGGGRTAQEVARQLGLPSLTIAHETRSLLALESLERSPRGVPNFFISRNGHKGEAAAYGEGVYARIGRKGAVGSGLTVRMVLRPDAREGSDFTLAKGTEDYVVLHNKAAAMIVNESYALSLVQYVESIGFDDKFDSNEKGLLEKLTRRLRAQLGSLTEQDHAKIRAIYQRAPHKTRIISELIRLGVPLPISESNYEHLVDMKMQRVRELKAGFKRAVMNANQFQYDWRGMLNEMEELASVARSLDAFVAALEFGMKFPRGSTVTIGMYTGARASLVSQYFDRMWAQVRTVDDVWRVRDVVAGTHSTGRLKELAAPMMKTASDLVRLERMQEGELGGFTTIDWIVKNPEKVMRLRPTAEELESLIPHRDRHEWVKRALPHATKASQVLALFEKEFRYSGGVHTAESRASFWGLWVSDGLKRFSSLSPTPEDSALARMIEARINPRASRTCESVFMHFVRQ